MTTTNLIKTMLKMSRDLPIKSPYKHICAIIKNDSVVAFGGNDTYKTHPLAKILGYSNGSVHAEFNALVKYICTTYHVKAKNIIRENFDLSNLELIVVRADSKGNPLNSRPCETCMKFIRRFGIKTIVHSVDGGFSWVDDDSIFLV